MDKAPAEITSVPFTVSVTVPPAGVPTLGRSNEAPLGDDDEPVGTTLYVVVYIPGGILAVLKPIVKVTEPRPGIEPDVGEMVNRGSLMEAEKLDVPPEFITVTCCVIVVGALVAALPDTFPPPLKIGGLEAGAVTVRVTGTTSVGGVKIGGPVLRLSRGRKTICWVIVTEPDKVFPATSPAALPVTVMVVGVVPAPGLTVIQLADGLMEKLVAPVLDVSRKLAEPLDPATAVMEIEGGDAVNTVVGAVTVKVTGIVTDGTPTKRGMPEFEMVTLPDKVPPPGRPAALAVIVIVAGVTPEEGLIDNQLESDGVTEKPKLLPVDETCTVLEAEPPGAAESDKEVGVALRVAVATTVNVTGMAPVTVTPVVSDVKVIAPVYVPGAKPAGFTVTESSRPLPLGIVAPKTSVCSQLVEVETPTKMGETAQEVVKTRFTNWAGGTDPFVDVKVKEEGLPPTPQVTPKQAGTTVPITTKTAKIRNLAIRASFKLSLRI
jgi:hypothetical protein